MGIQAVFFVAIPVIAVSIAAVHQFVGDRDERIRRFQSFSLGRH
jgi:hypothetical protein